MSTIQEVINAYRSRKWKYFTLEEGDLRALPLEDVEVFISTSPQSKEIAESPTMDFPDLFLFADLEYLSAFSDHPELEDLYGEFDRIGVSDCGFLKEYSWGIQPGSLVLAGFVRHPENKMRVRKLVLHCIPY